MRYTLTNDPEALKTMGAISHGAPGQFMSESLVLLGIIIAATSGLAGLLWGRTSMAGQWVATLLAVLGAGLGLGGIGTFWLTGDSQPIVLPWSLPGAEFQRGHRRPVGHLPRSGLSGFSPGQRLWPGLLEADRAPGKRPEAAALFRHDDRRHGTARRSPRNSILFLFGWEMMALSAFFLVATEDDEKEVREAGWLYLVATHYRDALPVRGLRASACRPRFLRARPARPGSRAVAGMATAIFVLAVVGFGLKAGIMPLHVWLPGAHAAAPSHVSAFMSGVLIKMGIYGLLAGDVAAR